MPSNKQSMLHELQNIMCQKYHYKYISIITSIVKKKHYLNQLNILLQREYHKLQNQPVSNAFMYN